MSSNLDTTKQARAGSASRAVRHIAVVVFAALFLAWLAPAEAGFICIIAGVFTAVTAVNAAWDYRDHARGSSTRLKRDIISGALLVLTGCVVYLLASFT